MGRAGGDVAVFELLRSREAPGPQVAIRVAAAAAGEGGAAEARHGGHVRPRQARSARLGRAQ